MEVAVEGLTGRVGGAFAEWARRRKPAIGPAIIARATALARAVAGGGDLSEDAEVAHVLEDGLLVNEWLLSAAAIPPAEAARLCGVLDRAVVGVAGRLEKTHTRALEAIERIFASLESETVDELLSRLLDAVLGVLPVDGGSILLRETDWLVVRAELGAHARGLACRIDEGFAGAVAATRTYRSQPGALAAGAGARGLFGFPLISQGDLIGALVLASQSRDDLSPPDVRLGLSLSRAAATAISARLGEQRAARRSAELDALIESIPAAIIVGDTTGLATRWNAKAVELTATDDVTTLLVHADVVRERLLVRALDTREPLAEEDRLYVRALAEERPIERQVLLRPLGATEDRVVAVRAAPIWLADEVVGVVMVGLDHTEQHEAERALRTRAEQQSAVAALGRFALVTHDPDAVQQLAERIVSKTTTSNHTAYSDFRETIALIVSTARERAERETELAKLYAEAEAAVRTREDVLAMVSHDLRSPLSAIQTSAQLLDPSLSERQQHEHAQRIVRAVDRMSRLIRDLLDMASVRAGRLAIMPVPESAAALVREAVELHEPAAHEKGIELRTELALDGAPPLRCDRERMMQVFANLIGNALKFCGRCSSITVRASYDERDFRFEVSDTGPGIEEEARAKVFDRYWSAPGHAKHGSGLGLFITKGIVDAHGGRIGVECPAPSGTTFWLTVPR